MRLRCEFQIRSSKPYLSYSYSVDRSQDCSRREVGPGAKVGVFSVLDYGMIDSEAAVFDNMA